MPGPDLRLDLLNLPLQLLEMLEQPVDEPPERAWQFDGRIPDELGHAPGDVGDPLRHDQPVLAKQSADLVGRRRSCSDEALANAVQCKDCLLFDVLIASASAASFLLLLTYGFTNCGAIRRAV